MKEIKLKKDIPTGTFVVVNSEVVKFNKKYKVAEMQTGENGILTFDSEEEGSKYLANNNQVSMKAYPLEVQANKTPIDILTIAAFQKQTKINVSIPNNRKRDKKGYYNFPITIAFAQEPQSAANEFAHEFVDRLKLNYKIENVNDEVFIQIFDRSKKSIINKLVKHRNLGECNFKNLGNLIAIY